MATEKQLKYWESLRGKKRGSKQKVKKVCPHCGKEFVSYVSEKKKYCSKDCYTNSGRQKHICIVCGKEFTKKKCYKGKSVRYCNQKCFFKDMKNNKSYINYWKSMKGKSFKNSGQFKKGNKSWNKGKKGLITWNKGKSGWLPKEKHGNWKGGITPENKLIRGSLKYIEWRKDIFERDDYICQICGKRGGNLRANHIKKFADYPELRFIYNNGITICRSCDIRWVLRHEEDWESYFNFNLETRRCVQWQR